MQSIQNPDVLPTGVDPAGTSKRHALFDEVDAAGSGMLSLVECDKAVRHLLGGGGDGDVLSSHNVVLHAFSVAKQMGSSGRSKDHVERDEFRLFLVYIRQFLELHAAYDRIDSSDDKRLSLPEFRQGAALLSRWGIDVEEAEVDDEFRRVDSDGSGLIGFDEFAEWALRRTLELEPFEEPAADGAAAKKGRRRRSGGGRSKEGPPRRSRSKPVAQPPLALPSPAKAARPGGMARLSWPETESASNAWVGVKGAELKLSGSSVGPRTLVSLTSERATARESGLAIDAATAPRILGGVMGAGPHAGPAGAASPARSSPKWGSGKHDTFLGAGSGKTILNYPW